MFSIFECRVSIATNDHMAPPAELRRRLEAELTPAGFTASDPIEAVGDYFDRELCTSSYYSAFAANTSGSSNAPRVDAPSRGGDAHGGIFSPVPPPGAGVGGFFNPQPRGIQSPWPLKSTTC
jgi:hypothetical protein